MNKVIYMLLFFLFILSNSVSANTFLEKSASSGGRISDVEQLTLERNYKGEEERSQSGERELSQINSSERTHDESSFNPIKPLLFGVFLFVALQIIKWLWQSRRK
jgi:hypothetical protein